MDNVTSIQLACLLNCAYDSIQIKIILKRLNRLKHTKSKLCSSFLNYIMLLY